MVVAGAPGCLVRVVRRRAVLFHAALVLLQRAPGPGFLLRTLRSIGFTCAVAGFALRDGRARLMRSLAAQLAFSERGIAWRDLIRRVVAISASRRTRLVHAVVVG